MDLPAAPRQTSAVTGAPPTRYARSPDGIHVAYQEMGQGEDVLLLNYPTVPIDLMWDEPLFARALRRLAGSHHLVTADLHSWGSSDVPGPPIPALQAWMDDVGAVLDAAGSTRSSIVVLGDVAKPALLFAATYPERVARLVLVNPSVGIVAGEDFPLGFSREDVERMLEYFCAGIGHGPVAKALAPTRADETLYLQWATRAERLSLRPGSAPFYAARFMLDSARGVLASVKCPCLILHRTTYLYCPIEHSRHLAKRLPDAQLVELPGDDYLWCSGDVDALFDEVISFVSGSRQTLGSHDRALATILFTDIVESTGRASALGDATWRRVLESYERTVASHVESFRGRLVKSTGDGSLASFDGPARAIHCASAIAQSVGGLGLDIRAGLHTGEVELMNGDLGGIAVHIAARVMAHARPGEVVVSASVPPLVVGSGIEFLERGEHQLKGVPGDWKLFAVGS